MYRDLFPVGFQRFILKLFIWGVFEEGICEYSNHDNAGNCLQGDMQSFIMVSNPHSLIKCPFTDVSPSGKYSKWRVYLSY